MHILSLNPAPLGPSLMSPKIFSGHILLFHSYQVSRVEEAFLQGIFTLFNLDQLFKTRLACKWDFAWKHKRNNSEQQWNIFGDYTNHMGSDFSQILATIHFIYTNISLVCPTRKSFPLDLTHFGFNNVRHILSLWTWKHEIDLDASLQYILILVPPSYLKLQAKSCESWLKLPSSRDKLDQKIFDYNQI